MALQKTLTFETPWGEMPVPECYIRVRPVVVSKAMARAIVTFHRAPDAPELPEQREVEFQHVSGLGAPDHLTQAYEHLKTLPEFADALDC